MHLKHHLAARRAQLLRQVGTRGVVGEGAPCEPVEVDTWLGLGLGLGSGLGLGLGLGLGVDDQVTCSPCSQPKAASRQGRRVDGQGEWGMSGTQG